MMQWQGRYIRNIRDLCNAMSTIKTKPQAVEFKRRYRLANPNADHNLGYVTGYFKVERMRELQELFGVQHPIFGNNIETANKAYETGLQQGGY